MALRRKLSSSSSDSKGIPSALLRDAKNRSMLGHLQAEPRIAVSELARRMKMSAPAVRERMLRMQEAGVIQRWRIDVDPVALGYPVMAFIRIKPAPGQLPKIAQLAQRMPQIVECHRVTGDDCFVMK